MCRGRAPIALRRPISRVRSVTETSMMFITPTPPTASVHDADQPEHRLQSEGKAVDHGAVFDRVPLGRGFVVLGIEVMAPRNDLAHRHQRLLVQFRSRGLNDDLVGIANVLQIAHQREGNESVLVVRALVHGVLDLVAHDADHFEIQPADLNVWPTAGRALKYFLRRLVAEDHHAAVIGEVASR